MFRSTLCAAAGARGEWYRSRVALSAKADEALGRAAIPGPGAGRRDGEVNTHLTTTAGKLYALVEAGTLPVELDAGLESVARSDFGFRLPPASDDAVSDSGFDASIASWRDENGN